MMLDTDQVRCFDELGRTLPCFGSGQDAAVPKPPPPPGGRFAADGGTVTDRLTGRVWVQNASLSPFPLSFPEAVAFVDGLNADGAFGIRSWRLPERRELFSLVSHERIRPSLPEGHPFEEVFHGYYWTGTTCARLPDQAWFVHLGGGRVYRGMKHQSYMVLPVSGNGSGSPAAGHRFSWRASLLRDRLAARTWRFSDRRPEEGVTWVEALAWVDALNREGEGGHGDWRLPNIRELESLCDTGRHTPATAFDGWGNGFPDGLWSATTSVFEPRYAWVFYPRDGAVGVGFKVGPEFHPAAVRTDPRTPPGAPGPQEGGRRRRCRSAAPSP